MATAYQLIKNFAQVVRDARQSVRAYVYVDDMTVIQRKPLPGSEGSGYKQDMVQVNVFDFSTGIMTTAMQPGVSGIEAQGSQGTPVLFTHIPNKQCIIDAHAALVKMGGTPPALEIFLGIPKKLDVDVDVNRPRIKGLE